MTDVPRLDEETKRKLARVSAATLTSQLLKRGFANTFIAGLIPLRPDLRMVGVAYTLRYIPTRADLAGDRFADEENAQRRAVETIGPGEVLMIDARGDTGAASFGDILATRIAVRGAAGLVTDGGLRDTPAFRELDLPSYTRAAHAVTSYTIHHPLETNVPIGCGGVAVLPGDVVVGDAEGVVVMPAGLAREVADEAFEQERLEEFLQAKVAAGADTRGVYPPDEATQAEYEAWREREGDR